MDYYIAGAWESLVLSHFEFRQNTLKGSWFIGAALVRDIFRDRIRFYFLWVRRCVFLLRKLEVANCQRPLVLFSLRNCESWSFCSDEKMLKRRFRLDLLGPVTWQERVKMYFYFLYSISETRKWGHSLPTFCGVLMSKTVFITSLAGTCRFSR